MKRLLRFTISGCLGAILGWLIFEPWSENFGAIRDFLLLYSVSYGIAFAIIIEKFFFAGTTFSRKIEWVKNILKNKYLYLIPLIGVFFTKCFIAFLFPIERPEVQNDVQIEIRYLLLDVSGSMCGDPLQELKSAVNKYLSILQETESQDMIGCITFSDSATLLFAPHTDYISMKNIINNLSCTGGTNMSSSLTLALENMKQQEFLYPKELILLSDGMPNNRDNVISIVQQIYDIPIHTIGVGESYDSSLLNKISSQTNAKFYSAEDVSKLSGIFAEIARQGLTQTNNKNNNQMPFLQRLLGWSICALLIGLTIGVGNEKKEMVLIGSIGGFLGGVLSCSIFVLIHYLNLTSGTLARFISFSILGICIGLTIFIVEYIYSRIKPVDSSFDLSKLTNK